MNATATEQPQNLLQALCRAHNVQGGTIHQYDLRRLRWACERRPDSKRNRAGSYVLEYDHPDEGVMVLATTHASSARDLPAICPEMRTRWYDRIGEPDTCSAHLPKMPVVRFGPRGGYQTVER